MNYKKKISCHVITYNHANYIEKCINSILSQKTKYDFEIVIGDDLSTDGTRDIIQSYREKFPEIIKLNLRSERGTGIPGKENFLSTLALCEGEYITLCDGDDYWTDTLKLHKQVSFLELHSEYVLNFHPIKILEKNGELTDDYITKVPEYYDSIEDLAILGNYIHTPSVMFRNILGELPEEMILSPIGDYFIYMLLAQE